MLRSLLLPVALLLLSCVSRPGALRWSVAEAMDEGEPGDHGFLNLPLPTLGGLQFWADVHWQGGWRIQENVVTGHHRLLDPRNVRRAWGSYAACRRCFEERWKPAAAPPSSAHLVVVLHGLGRSRSPFGPMVRALREAGFEAVAVGYPSMRASVDEHAERLNRLLDGLEGFETVSFLSLIHI